MTVHAHDSRAKTLRNLAELLALHAALPAQAVAQARALVDGRSLPGGAAMVDLGPVGDVSSWQRRLELAEHTETVTGVAPATRPDPTLEDEQESAFQTIAYWATEFRWRRGEVWDQIPTFDSEVKYLAATVDWVADQPEWDHFRNSIRDARRHLENVVQAGARPDTTRVECNNPLCPAPDPTRPDAKQRLIRTYAPRWNAAWACTSCGTETPARRRCATCGRRTGPGPDREHCRHQRGDRDACDGVLEVEPIVCGSCGDHDLQPTWTSHPTDDGWKCTRCKTRYDHDAFRRAHAEQLRRDTAAKYVPLPDAIATLVAQGRNERVVRRWLEPPLTPVDRCTRCRRRWPAGEHNACPRKLKRRDGTLTGEECGGLLERIYVGDPEAVVDAYCDLATHRTFAWWPDLWRLHLATPTRRRSAS